MGTRCRPLTPATSGISWPLQVPHTSRNRSTGLVIHSEVVSVGLPRADVGLLMSSLVDLCHNLDWLWSAGK